MNLDGLSAWRGALAETLAAPYFAELSERVAAARASAEVYPPEECEFAAFSLCAPEAVRVVILGQDPYHEPGQAHGLAFSVPDGVALPPSLRNIYKEAEADLRTVEPASGDLTRWAKQGVLLLNTVLTVERGSANSHAKFGWQTFTDDVIRAVGRFEQPIAFVLWGGQAQKKEALIERPAPRLILKSAHPSPLSCYRGFSGSRPFSKINQFLESNGQPPIEW
jgi:uracil-DNA glycosylase